jgi:hypothetical protein
MSKRIGMRLSETWHQGNGSGKDNLEVSERIPPALLGGECEIGASVLLEIVLPVSEGMGSSRIGGGEEVWSWHYRYGPHPWARERKVQWKHAVAGITPPSNIPGVLFGVSSRNKRPNTKTRCLPNEQGRIQLASVVIGATYWRRMGCPPQEMTKLHPQNTGGAHQL